MYDISYLGWEGVQQSLSNFLLLFKIFTLNIFDTASGSLLRNDTLDLTERTKKQRKRDLRRGGKNV